MQKTQHGICALCKQERDLQLSHIVPNFVGRMLKKTSPGNIRNAAEPNKVAQDIEKRYLLCHECEELFSAKETWFANHIFNSYIGKKETVFSYDENLTYFVISLSWRSLYLDLEGFKKDSNIDPYILKTLIKSEKIMRDYLIGKSSSIDYIENHIFFLDRIESTSGVDMSKNPSVAMHRSISSYTVYYPKTYFTISNLMGILIVTFYSKDDNEHWENTEINLGCGIIESKNQYVESVVSNEINFWMEQSENAKENLSDRQQAKIKERLQKLGEDFKKYPIYRDLRDDGTL
ncbi:hypothetical protein [Clostridium tyrobutyricum]|uniref:hypothetical protein n=1 Tax=Clostridium tyrobutyricum TaxID=1519 RepID=UPI00189F9CA2|nr:hypothetical protein [Clostridium tyrobutyricum]